MSLPEESGYSEQVNETYGEGDGGVYRKPFEFQLRMVADEFEIADNRKAPEDVNRRNCYQDRA